MNLPNKITIFRIILIPFVVITLYYEYTVLSTILFIIASLSDALDGYIARKYKLITDLGKILDPVADKLLVYSVLLVLVYLNRISFIFVIILLMRDLLVDAIRNVAASKGEVIAANMAGKIKTVTQMVSIIFLMLNNYPFTLFTDVRIDKILFFISVVLSVISGFIYAKNAKKYFKN